MIDPFNLTNFSRTPDELEELILFGILVAGKRADIIVKKLEHFLSLAPQNSPFNKIKYMIDNKYLLKNLKIAKMGNYKITVKALKEVINLDINNLTIEKLEKVSKIGPKTSRMIMLHSFPDQKCAVLDVHILRFMRENLKIMTPKNTPTGKKYLKLEKIFVNYAILKKRNIAELDLAIWKKFTRSKNVSEY